MRAWKSLGAYATAVACVLHAVEWADVRGWEVLGALTADLRSVARACSLSCEPQNSPLRVLLLPLLMSVTMQLLPRVS